jgi:hypothetical protein
VQAGASDVLSSDQDELGENLRWKLNIYPKRYISRATSRLPFQSSHGKVEG